MLASDFGDAPDVGEGTATGSYHTLLASNGPSHVIDTTRTTLFLGAHVDPETDATPNSRANGDDIATAFGFTQSADDLPQSINDLATTTSHLTVSDTNGFVSDVNVTLDVTHSFVGNLVITLVSPTGTRVVLSNRNGGAGENFNGSRFDDEAVNSLTAGSAPFASVFRPDASLSAFDNEPLDGDWQLQIEDKMAGNVGVLNSWSLTFPTFPNDEDGVIEPAQDLALTVGSAPLVRVRATNTTGSAATLYGWIDFNRDGVFDNTTERTSVAVPTATTQGTFFLTFPTIPAGDSAGATYARFRLSTDIEAANSTGAATDGEVEDYAATITQRGDGTVDNAKNLKLASGTNGGPTLANVDFFGNAIASLGDLDGDGVNDLAVGADRDDTGGTERGAVHVLLLNANGSIKSSVKIASESNGGPTLANEDHFGASVAALGDVDGDGVTDLAVGAYQDDTGGTGRGAVHLLMLNSDGTVKNSVTIASGQNGGATLANGDFFGTSVASLGDLDGDGVNDLVAGASGDNTGNGPAIPGNYDRGAVHVLLLNSDGTVKSRTKIASETNGGPLLANSDYFGGAVTSLGDLDGDGVTDLAVGAKNDDTNGVSTGAVHVLFLNANGTVKSSLKLANATNGGPTLGETNNFGVSVASMGDLDGDGVTDLAVGANRDQTGGQLRGAVHLLLLNANGSVKSRAKLASGTFGGPVLADYDFFGTSVASLGDIDGDGATELAVGARGDDTGGLLRGAVHVLFLRELFFSDFGDAPDTGAETEAGDYQTLLANAGPSHVISTTRTSLFLGARVDGDADGSPSSKADGDDIARSVPEDEDGLIEPAQDLLLTVGSAPVVRVRATNTTGAAATLFGWIDINRDGTFDNATERTSVVVPNSTLNGTFSLSFPSIATSAAAGTTYARFRLSADVAAANSTGAATGGEVEDYAATISRRSDGSADNAKSVKLASGVNGVPTLANFDYFGSSMASLGDLDGDGVGDLAVGADQDDTAGVSRGAVSVLLLNANGSVKSSVKLTSAANGGPTLSYCDYFGSSLASLGDLDGDGINDLAVGATGDDTGGAYRGAVYVLMLNANGTVKSRVKLANNTNGGPTLADADFFGRSVAALGDLDGDGVTDLAVGADRDNTNGTDRGAVHVLLLNANGTVKSSVKLASGTNGGPALANTDNFGRAVTSLGDLDGDGVTDLAVGASGDDTGGDNRGAVHVLLLNANGSVKSSRRIAHQATGGLTLSNLDGFGGSVASLGDLDGDGITDLGVGAIGDDAGGPSRGAVHVLLLNANGSLKSRAKLASGVSGGPALGDYEFFGRSVAALGDLDGDGVTELGVGATGDDTNGSGRGAVHVLFLQAFLGPAVSVTASTHGVLEDGATNVNFVFTRTGGTSESLTANFSVGGSATLNNDYQTTGADSFSSAAGTVTFAIGASTATVSIFPIADASLETNETVVLTVLANPNARVIEPNVASSGLVNDEPANVRIDLAGRLVLTDLAARADRLTVTFNSVTQQLVIADPVNALTTGAGVLIGRNEVRIPIAEITQRFLLAELGDGDDRLTLSSLPAAVFALGTSVQGGAGNDILEGGAEHDAFDGGLGNDILTGGGGADTISGSGGNDRITANSTVGVSISGGSGNDTITTGAGNDSITAAAGADRITSGAGNDQIFGGTGNDTVDAGTGNDFVLGQDDNDSILGGDGDDSLQGSDGADFLDGGTGKDRLFGVGGDDRLVGGTDNDSLFGDAGNDTLDGGAGTDQLRGGFGVDDLDGGTGSDRVSEEGDTDFLIIGLQLSSPLFGTELTRNIERFNLNGGPGNNLLDGRQATVPVFLTGNDGNDTLLGGALNDFLFGGNGADVLSGGAGIDTIDGGLGTDYFYEKADADFTVTGLRVVSTMTGDETAVGIERIALVGGDGNNRLDATASSVRVVLLGGRGNDTLVGGFLQDTLSGGARGLSDADSGTDNLDGLAGADTSDSDAADTHAADILDTVVADVFALLPSWLDFI